MTTLFTLVVLLIIAYSGREIFTRIEVDNLWLKGLAYSGIGYIVLGLMLGPQFSNLLKTEIIGKLQIIYVLVLGWVGLLIGLQFNIGHIKRFRKEYFAYGVLNFLMVFLITFLLLSTAIKYVTYVEFKVHYIFLFALAGAMASPIVLGVISKDYNVKGKLANLLQFNSAFNNLLGVTVFGIFTAVAAKGPGPGEIGYRLLLFAGVTGVAIISSFIYSVLSKEMKTEQETFLLVISLLLASVGVAYLVGQSLLFTAFAFGFGLSNLKINTRPMFLAIQKAEKPLYILLLLFTGINLGYQFVFIWYLLVFLLVHIISNLTASLVAGYVLEKKERLPATGGLANIGMGGLSLAIVLEYHLFNGSQITQLLIFVLSFSILLNDLIALKFLEKNVVRN